jgi:hypothetical protein
MRAAWRRWDGSQGARPQTRKTPLSSSAAASQRKGDKGLKALPRGIRKCRTISNVVAVEHLRSINRWMSSACFTLCRRRACASFGPSDDATPGPRRTSNAGSRDHPDNAAPLRLPRSAPSARRGLKLFSKPQKHATTAVWRGWAGRDNDINPTVLVVVQRKKFGCRPSSQSDPQARARFEFSGCHIPRVVSRICSGTNGPCRDRHLDPCKRRGLDHTERVVPSRNVLLERGNPPNTVRSRLTRCESHRQVVS